MKEGEREEKVSENSVFRYGYTSAWEIVDPRLRELAAVCQRKSGDGVSNTNLPQLQIMNFRTIM